MADRHVGNHASGRVPICVDANSESVPGSTARESCTSSRPPAMEYPYIWSRTLLRGVQSEVTIEKETQNIEFCYMQVLLP